MRAFPRGTVLTAALVASVAVASPAGAITIDPSSQDTFILSDSPNLIRGQSARIKVRSKWNRTWRGLVQFDLSSIPQYSTINSATLRLREVNAPLPAAKTHGVYKIIDSWLQNSVKWSNQPGHAASATATATVGTAKTDRDFTVDPDVQAWVNAPASNHGWMIIDQAEPDENDDIVTYVARETRDNLTRKPKLLVDFTAPECTTVDDCTNTNPCSVNLRCEAGHCAVDPRNCEEDPPNLCTDDICDPGQPVGQECVHSSKCDDGFSCTADSCNPSNGACTNTPVDNNCTAEGCKEGTCVADPDRTDLDEAGCFITAVNPDDTPCTPDSNQCTDDKCLAGLCTHPFSALGTPCDDSDPCTIPDECNDAGVCIGNPDICGDGIVQGTCGEECDDGVVGGRNCTTQCRFICGPAPQIGCRKPAVPKKAVIVLKDKTPDTKDALVWNWNKGTATLLADFGAPLTTTGFTLCLYDQSANPQPLIFVKAPPEGTCGIKPCWRTTKTTGYKYTDKLLDPDGVAAIMLKVGADSKAKIVVRGKGANLHMAVLPPTPKVTVQLKRDDDLGTCWDAEYTTPIKNLSDLFKAVAD